MRTFPPLGPTPPPRQSHSQRKAAIILSCFLLLILTLITGLSLMPSIAGATGYLFSAEELRRMQHTELLANSHLSSSQSSAAMAALPARCGILIKRKVKRLPIMCTKKLVIATSIKSPASSSSLSSSASSSSVKNTSAVAPGKKLMGFDVDLLPFNQPHAMIMVYGNLSQVFDICPYTIDFKTKGLADFFNNANLALVEEVEVYDLATHKQVGKAVRALGLHGKFSYTESDEALTESEKNVSQVYFRLKISPYDATRPNYLPGQAKYLCTNPKGELDLHLMPDAITDVVAAGPGLGILEAANQAPIGSFTFKTQRSDKDQKISVQSMRFLVHSTPKTVKYSHMFLKTDGIDEIVECHNEDSSHITCDSIPEHIGTIDGERTYSVYADIISTGTAGNIQLELSEFGDIFHSGSIKWKNTHDTYQWLTPAQMSVMGTLYQK